MGFYDTRRNDVIRSKEEVVNEGFVSSVLSSYTTFFFYYLLMLVMYNF